MNNIKLQDLLASIQEYILTSSFIVPEQVISSLTSDSRKVIEGALFVAIKGSTIDGHDFIAEVIENNVAALVVETIHPSVKKDCIEKGVSIIELGNTRLAYTKLCFSWWGNPQKEIKAAAITGTNGKTTVATLLWQLLNKSGIKADLLSTAGKIIGPKQSASSLTTSDPYELAQDFRTSVDLGTQVLVMEASSHALDQHRVAGIDFITAAFTNLSRDHLDYHGTMEAYANAKFILFKHLKKHALAVINADDEYASLMAQTAAKKCMISFEPIHAHFDINVYCRIKSISAKGMQLSMNDRELNTSLIGAFNAKNLVMAWQMAAYIGADEALMEVAVPGLVAAAGRMEHIGIDSPDVLPHVIVDYAHTSDAMENTLAAVHQVKGSDQQIWVVFGCGGDRDRGKRPVMASTAAKFGDKVIFTNDNPRSEQPTQIFEDMAKGMAEGFEYQIIEDRAKAIKDSIFEAKSNDIVMILGKGHETYQEIQGQRHHFDDREWAKKALEERSVQLHHVRRTGDS